jgi:hypothetical protein
LLAVKGSRWNFGVILPVIVGHIAHVGERRDVYKILVDKPERNRPHVRPRHRWEDNIKMDLQRSGMGGMDWIDLAQDKDRWRVLVNSALNIRVP